MAVVKREDVRLTTHALERFEERFPTRNFVEEWNKAAFWQSGRYDNADYTYYLSTDKEIVFVVARSGKSTKSKLRTCLKRSQMALRWLDRDAYIHKKGFKRGNTKIMKSARRRRSDREDRPDY